MAARKSRKKPPVANRKKQGTKRPAKKSPRRIKPAASLAAAPLRLPLMVFLVRHGERNNGALTPTGIAQANTLAQLLKDAGINAIYTSQFPRTKQTAAPLQQLLQAQGNPVHMEELPLGGPLQNAPDNAALLKAYGDAAVATLRAKSSGEIVLIIGHDATVSAIIKSLGFTGNAAILPTEFDHLFLVTPRPGPGAKPPGFFHLRHYAP